MQLKHVLPTYLHLTQKVDYLLTDLLTLVSCLFFNSAMPQQYSHQGKIQESNTE